MGLGNPEEGDKRTFGIAKEGDPRKGEKWLPLGSEG